jgi:hypothetical protein
VVIGADVPGGAVVVGTPVRTATLDVLAILVAADPAILAGGVRYAAEGGLARKIDAGSAARAAVVGVKAALPLHADAATADPVAAVAVIFAIWNHIRNHAVVEIAQFTWLAARIRIAILDTADGVKARATATDPIDAVFIGLATGVDATPVDAAGTRWTAMIRIAIVVAADATAAKPKATDSSETLIVRRATVVKAGTVGARGTLGTVPILGVLAATIGLSAFAGAADARGAVLVDVAGCPRRTAPGERGNAAGDAGE